MVTKTSFLQNKRQDRLKQIIFRLIITSIWQINRHRIILSNIVKRQKQKIALNVNKFLKMIG